MGSRKQPAYTVTVIDNATGEIDTHAGDIILATAAVSEERRSHSRVRAVAGTPTDAILETLSWLVTRTLISTAEVSIDKLDPEYLLMKLAAGVLKKIGETPSDNPKGTK